MKQFAALAALLALTANAQAAFPYQSCFEVAAKLHRVPLDLLLAVAATESAWDPDARSTANAHGIMQIQWPGTARHLGVTRVAELYNPCLNIDLGARYLAELMVQNNGAVDRALAAYNYGPARIAGAKALPPGAIRYVNTVLGHRRVVSKSLARGVAPALKPGTSHAVARFDSALRARRYAEGLRKRATTLAVHASESPEGGHVVTLVVPEQGLSSSDASLLQALGLST